MNGLGTTLFCRRNAAVVLAAVCLFGCGMLAGRTERLVTNRPVDQVTLAAIEALKSTANLKLEFVNTTNSYLRAVGRSGALSGYVVEVRIGDTDGDGLHQVVVEVLSPPRASLETVDTLRETLYERIAQRIEEIKQRYQ